MTEFSDRSGGRAPTILALSVLSIFSPRPAPGQNSGPTQNSVSTQSTISPTLSAQISGSSVSISDLTTKLSELKEACKEHATPDPQKLLSDAVKLLESVPPGTHDQTLYEIRPLLQQWWRNSLVAREQSETHGAESPAQKAIGAGSIDDRYSSNRDLYLRALHALDRAVNPAEPSVAEYMGLIRSPEADATKILALLTGLEDSGFVACVLTPHLREQQDGSIALLDPLDHLAKVGPDSDLYGTTTSVTLKVFPPATLSAAKLFIVPDEAFEVRLLRCFRNAESLSRVFALTRHESAAVIARAVRFELIKGDPSIEAKSLNERLEDFAKLSSDATSSDAASSIGDKLAAASFAKAFSIELRFAQQVAMSGK